MEKGLIKTAKNLREVFSKNSPTILTGLAVTGLVTTTILGIKATPKALSLIDDYVWELYECETLAKEGGDQEEISFEEWLYNKRSGTSTGYSWKDRVNLLFYKDLIRLTWKVYLPTIGVGLATIACIVGANHISSRRTAALASVYGITEAALKEYEKKVVDTIGSRQELKIRDEIAKDQIIKSPPGENEVIFTGKGEVLCYDSLSGRYFKSDMFISLNEVYDALGLSSTSLGNDLGWDIDKGMIEISFSTQLTEQGDPCLILNYRVQPKFLK